MYKYAYSFMQRTVWTIVMLVGFIGVIASGPLYCTFLIQLIMFSIFKEIISLKRNFNKEIRIPWFFVINWYFFFVGNYFFYGLLFQQKLKGVIIFNTILQIMIKYHKFISFSLWIIGFLVFVISLKKGYYRYQFRQFAWTHLALILVVAQVSFIIVNLLDGMIWFILPTMLVITNDIFAYIFGKIFGKTKLIELSPKKTWEGFIGGFFSSILFALFLSGLLQQIPLLICPSNKLIFTPFIQPDCTPNQIFIYKQYDFPEVFQAIFNIQHIYFSDFQFHSLVLSMFASLIAPFGGFFASGFKRAIKIKDFADVIPGHGGITDRMDCQLLMVYIFFIILQLKKKKGMFTYVYIHQFVLGSQSQSVENILMGIVSLSNEKQVLIYKQLGKILLQKNLLLDNNNNQ
ncbi:phosphatidate cytidylyltransferase, putative [Ichthyophthirius multifiliis]|uniref:Phosphatidate cytidylyltransferase n=1 Tax=Ichthyophthirius multifiliis TaxID=5932 RepID=G0QK00_ICHMU|nr:phosphatidate cytidylyltransferase, putative [Ichthyophthirius multifiliis]EGR34460.1 phosphatidate cytidylyltransferase, putative [Ichthyophthirius multifiliis]|eukprot:XP_004039764.1 phosphatidate cytidylyltransferase, putative [Ichthyophthirius multifiliis]